MFVVGPRSASNHPDMSFRLLVRDRIAFYSYTRHSRRKTDIESATVLKLFPCFDFLLRWCRRTEKSTGLLRNMPKLTPALAARRGVAWCSGSSSNRVGVP